MLPLPDGSAIHDRTGFGHFDRKNRVAPG